MRVQEIIRGILDMIDNAEQEQATVAPTVEAPEEQSYSDDVRRFRQIIDLADQGQPTEYSNTPKEEYAGLDAVTTAAGGGMNGAKHVKDLRGDSFRIYGDN